MEARGKVALAKIPPANRIQLREALNTDAVEDYAERMRTGDELPPVVVFVGDDGQWLAEGNHRVAAAEKVGLDSIACEFRRGDRPVATLHAASANQAHGVRRSNADKRRAVEAVLELAPEWGDRRIADHVGVDHRFVARLRPASTGDDPQPAERIGRDGKKRKLPSKPASQPAGEREPTAPAPASRAAPEPHRAAPSEPDDDRDNDIGDDVRGLVETLKKADRAADNFQLFGRELLRQLDRMGGDVPGGLGMAQATLAFSSALDVAEKLCQRLSHGTEREGVIDV